MSEIINNKLYLGNVFDVGNHDFIKNKNISCIICVAKNLQMNKPPNVKMYQYDLDDDYNCNISSYFNEIGEIIDNEQIVLINCYAGVSRSATIVIAYLMKKYNKNLYDTFIYVRNNRKCICPNQNFMQHLLEYEKSLFGKNSMTFDECIKLFFYT